MKIRKEDLEEYTEIYHWTDQLRDGSYSDYVESDDDYIVCDGKRIKKTSIEEILGIEIWTTHFPRHTYSDYEPRETYKILEKRK